MRVLSAPTGLRWVAAALFASVPLSAVGAVLVTNAPWWRLPYTMIAFVALPSVVISPVLAFFILRANRISLSIFAVFATFGCLTCLGFAFRYRDTSLGFLTLILALISCSYWAWLKLEIGRSFLDPGIRWYQGLPKPIPDLKCEVADLPYRVSRIDREGAFVFSDSLPAMTDAQRSEWVKAGKGLEMVFSFRGRQARCTGVPVLALDRVGSNSGVGVQFRGMSPDMRKQLGDFVETIKGEGYA